MTKPFKVKFLNNPCWKHTDIIMAKDHDKAAKAFLEHYAFLSRFGSKVEVRYNDEVRTYE